MFSGVSGLGPGLRRRDRCLDRPEVARLWKGVGERLALEIKL